MAPAERVQMILDVDTGMDDALALLLALRCPSIDVLAVTCVQGNVDVQQVARNTLQVLDAAQAPEDLPVAAGFEEPLVEPVKNCPEIHGEDGMGDLKPTLPLSKRRLRPEHAVELLNTTIQNAPGKVTVVGLAPLTNIAVALRMRPSLWREKVQRIVWMGGAVASGGNATSWGEANARYDPEAAHIVLNSGLEILMYPWDVFTKVHYSIEELGQLGIVDVDKGASAVEQPPWTVLAGRLLWREIHHFGMGAADIGDAGAVVAAMLGEPAAQVKSLHVAVELQGSHTRGMTACDLRLFVSPPDEAQRPPNVQVVVDVDASAIKEFFTSHVLRQ